MVGQVQALQGMAQAEQQFNTVASRIAHLPVETAASSDSVDLSAEAVALLQARNNFEALTKIMKTGDRMEQALLDTIG
jgi:flagellar basal body rod protein FlgG